MTPQTGTPASRTRGAQRHAGTGPKDQPGRGHDEEPRPGRQPALAGAEWRKAAARAARRRPAKAPAAAVKAPAVPLPASGARLTATATCLSGCGWTAGPGDPAEVDRAAAKHTKGGHATNLFSEPARGAA